MTTVIDFPTPHFRDLVLADNSPRVHGNGFLQLDLAPGYRLHVWDEGLPKQKEPSTIHDHIFGIESRVICGVLIHLEYGLWEDREGEYDILQAVAQPGTNNTILENTGVRAGLKLMEEQRLPAGSSYFFEPFAFHDTQFQGTTATIMRKVPVLSGDIKPRVLVPHGREPDNDFDREGFDPAILWPFVDRALSLAHALEKS